MSNELNDNATHHPLLADLSAEDILIAAARWQALTSRQVKFPLMAPQGFTDAEQSKRPNERSLTMTMELMPPGSTDLHEGVVAAHQDAVYKLTELADIVRDRYQDERSA